MHTHITAQDNDKNIYFIGLEFLSFNIISYQDILLNKIIVAITLHCCLQCLRQNFARTACPAHNITGGPCRKGTYCPPGSSHALLCPRGYYCESEQLDAPTDPCMEGYLCPPGNLPPRS